MKGHFGIAFFILMIFLGCSKNKPAAISLVSRDNLKGYLDNASNPAVNYEKRLFYNKKALTLLLRQNNDSLNRDALIKTADNYYKLFAWNDLKDIGNIVLKRSIQKKDNYFIAESYKCLGQYYVNISINDSAFYYFSKAEKIYNKINNPIGLCKINLEKALVQYYGNDYLGSELSSIKALKIAKRYHLLQSEYDCYTYLQLNSNELQDYQSAIDYSKKSLILTKENNFLFKPEDVSFSLKLIGFSYYRWDKMKEAVKYFKLAMMGDKHGIRYPSSYCLMLDNYANAQLKLRKYNTIEKIHLESSKIRDSLHIDQGRNLNKLYLSEYYEATNQIAKSQKFAYEAYYLSKDYRNAGDMLLCLKQLSKVDSRNALKYSQEYIRISDSMQLLERQTRNKFAAIAYETQEITTEKDQAIKQKWIFFSIAVLLLLIGALLFIIIYQRTKQKEFRFIQEQQKANDEIYQLIQNQQTKLDEGRYIEKKRIAQDLHDGVMNRLASTRLNLQSIVEKPSLETLKKCLPFIDGIQDIEKEIRNIAHDLNSNAWVNKTSFIAVIESFIDNQKRISYSKYHLEIDMSINWEALVGFKKIHLFRILQEAIQNIEKHAQAKNIIVSILKRENQLLIEIFDDGKGFSLNRKKKGIGLQNIFSRAKSCKGIAEIKSKENEGTTIIVKIPI